MDVVVVLVVIGKESLYRYEGEDVVAGFWKFSAVMKNSMGMGLDCATEQAAGSRQTVHSTQSATAT